MSTDSSSAQANDSSGPGAISSESGLVYRWSPEMYVDRFGPLDVGLRLRVQFMEDTRQDRGARQSAEVAARTREADVDCRSGLQKVLESYDANHPNVTASYAETADRLSPIDWWASSVASLVGAYGPTREDEVTRGRYVFRKWRIEKDAYCYGGAATEEVLAAFTRGSTEVLRTTATVSPYISVSGTTLGLHLSANLGDPTFADSVSTVDKELTMRRLKAVEESFSNTFEPSFAKTLRNSFASEPPATDFTPGTMLSLGMVQQWTTAVENRIRAAGLPEITVRPAELIVKIDLDYEDEGTRSAFVPYGGQTNRRD
ncbi:hypothetical protein BCR39DRAFT_506295 [Naematelia encephala]|uniref:Uncharacterized protein n=1 Tax=Naematelia encephala TaxID=71784 RepID=A0A1Y2AXW7_9TREE|nr:hypothetical protein BCR39DRAFT_506295 [Naematelia encephala]